MDKNFKLIIEYDGTEFFGWQRQKDKKTIQGEIEKALTRILNQDIKITASGRTDAGVHAFGQVANFYAATDILPKNIKKGVNSLVQNAIVIRQCCSVKNDFHARYKAVSKEYHYFILNRKDPCAINRFFQWHIRYPLDIDTMSQCCQAVTGIFDFKAFENTGSPRSSTIREIFFFNISQLGDNRLVFKICANGFLKYMVRNLLGTIVLVGLNKMSFDKFINILESKDRTKAGSTAPPHGLFLRKVTYS